MERRICVINEDRTLVMSWTCVNASDHFLLWPTEDVVEKDNSDSVV